MSNDLLAAATRESRESILVADAEGLILHVNPAFERMCGFLCNELHGQPIGSLHSNGSADHAELLAALRTGTPWRGTLSNHRKSGEQYEEDILLVPIADARGRISHFLHTSREVTDQKRLQRIAETSLAMNNASYVLAGIRHEMGNAVNSLGMAVEVLSRTFSAHPEPHIAELLALSMAEVRRVEQLLATMKTFSVFDTAKLEPLDMAQFIDRFAHLIRGSAHQRHIGLAASVAPGTGMALADAHALQQVMLNLAVNAIDALADRPDPVLTIHAFRQSDSIRITVADNGCGMSPDQVNNLFKPFHTTKPQGTGLGLVLARNLLGKMRGSIDVASTFGVGTTVTITAPASASHANRE